MPTLQLKGLAAATADSAAAANSTKKGPPDLATVAAIKAALAPVRGTLPQLYRASVYDPLVADVNTLTPADFQWLRAHPANTPFWDVLQAVLQNASGYEARATDAFQEVVGDLYDGFLGAEDRARVKLPDRGVIPPLVKWGNPDDGPYTWPVDAMTGLNVGAGVVNLPPSHAHRGLLGWATLGHETGGHDILGADTGLLSELANVTDDALRSAGHPAWMARYWSDRIDETAADVLGLLNMGPAAGIGMVGYFRGLMGAWTGKRALRSDGPANDPHPADVVRGYLAAAVIRLLRFSARKDWANAIEAETDKDVTTIKLAGHVITTDVAKDAAAVVGRAIADTKLAALENSALHRIQDWKDTDESLVGKLMTRLVAGKTTIPSSLADDTYATHVVAAAVTAAVLGHAAPQALMESMIGMLKHLHDDNPSWGPMFVGHRGDNVRHPVAIRPRAARND